jgi:magnesium-transporting ATPase (P-type)
MTRPPRRANKRLVGKLLLWRCFFVCHAIVVLVIGLFYWAGQDGLSLGQQRAEAFAVLVGCQVVYFINCRFLKASTLHPRVLRGNWLMYVVTTITVGFMVSHPGSYTGNSRGHVRFFMVWSWVQVLHWSLQCSVWGA